MLSVKNMFFPSFLNFSVMFLATKAEREGREAYLKEEKKKLDKTYKREKEVKHTERLVRSAEALNEQKKKKPK